MCSRVVCGRHLSCLLAHRRLASLLMVLSDVWCCEVALFNLCRLLLAMLNSMLLFSLATHSNTCGTVQETIKNSENLFIRNLTTGTLAGLKFALQYALFLLVES
jgi:hypothetical protein